VPDRHDLSSTARVFFALWPDAERRAVLAEASRRVHALCAGRLTRDDTLHLTLVFIGAIERARLPELIEAAGRVRTQDFVVDFERLGCWRHNKIAYLSPSRAPQALQQLVAALEQALDGIGAAYDRRAYKPHVTLVRRGDCTRLQEETLNPPIRWPATEFVLVESRLSSAGAAYSILGRFSLAGGGPPLPV
jgi:2'-5' RNA ligase